MYLIDSDVFISAKNLHYAFDVVPAFWTWLEKAHGEGRVFTVQRSPFQMLRAENARFVLHAGSGLTT